MNIRPGHLFAVLTLPAALTAGEVSLNNMPPNTVYTGGGTVSASRQHGAYWAASAAYASDFSATTRNALQGLEVSDENGWMASIKAGYFWENQSIFRPAVEVEVNYIDNELRGGKGNTTFRGDMYHLSLLVNAVLALDFSVKGEESLLDFFHPYIGAGVGVAYSSINSLTVATKGAKDDVLGDSSETSLVYQVFGGIEFELDDYVSLFGEYRHFTMDDIAGSNVGDANQSLWTLGVKVNY